jgi:hypothetical protein
VERPRQLYHGATVSCDAEHERTAKNNYSLKSFINCMPIHWFQRRFTINFIETPDEADTFREKFRKYFYQCDKMETSFQREDVRVVGRQQ